jgi:putative flippase GtrA
MILSNPKERTRFLRFAVVGLVGAVIDFGVFNLEIGVFQIPSTIAAAVSFILAVISNFVLNRFWTYPDSRTKQLSHQLTQFGIVSLVGLGIRTLFFTWMEPPLINLFENSSLHISLTPSFLGHNITLAVSIGVVMLWNFFANRYWTYADVE